MALYLLTSGTLICSKTYEMDELARITPTHAQDVCFQIILPGTLGGYQSGVKVVNQCIKHERAEKDRCSKL